MSKTRKAMSMILMVISLVSISFAQEIRTDYDRNVHFSQYKTFSFQKVQTQNPLWADRITSSVSAALTTKGLTQVSSGGDISIVAVEMIRDQQTLKTFYDNFGGGWGWRWGGGVGNATTTTDTYRVGTLVIDLFDTNSKKLIWRGSATDALSDKSSKNINKLDMGVGKLFKEFPPKG